MLRKTSFFFIILVLTVSVLAVAQQRERKPVKFNKLSDNLYELLDGRGSKGGVYIGDDGVLVIDAKMDKQSVDEVLDGIMRITDKPVTYLVNTHSDGDHISGNRYFPESVTIVAHENCRKEFFHPRRDGTPSEWTKSELAPFLPEITFSKNLDLYLGSKKVELWYFGVGHTKGDAVVYFPEEKIAFVGDQIFVERPQLIHSYKGGNSFGHVKVLTRMLETLDAEKFSSGHSDIIGRTEIWNHIYKIRTIQEKVKTLAGAGKTLDEVKSEFEENQGRLVTSIYNEVTAQ